MYFMIAKDRAHTLSRSDQDGTGRAHLPLWRMHEDAMTKTRHAKRQEQRNKQKYNCGRECVHAVDGAP
jgi:ABC-type tungstate transport system permease subunit